MRFIRSRSIRFQITVGSVAIAAVVLTLASVAIHAQIRSITRGSDETLAISDLGSFIADIRGDSPEGPDDPGPGVLVLVRDPSGDVLISTMPPELGKELNHFRDGSGAVTVREDDTDYVVVHRTVSTDDGEWKLWAARSTAASDLTVAAMDRSLVIGAGLVLVAFGVAAWLLATAALRPVARMRETADSLSREPGGGELPVGPADDELSALASTLNRFIGRVRDTAHRERQMVSDASHELRTPLAVVATQLELAHRSFGDAEALRGEILAAEVSLARLSRLATTLLELSQIEASESAGAPATRGESSTGGELVTEVMTAVDRARVLAGPAGIDVEFETAEFETGEATATAFRISMTSFGRVLDNLVMNALVATDPGGTILLDVRPVDGGLSLSIADSGCGVPPDFLPRAFDRFSRADTSRARSSGGSGLGLALVHAIVERAGGTVTLANRDKTGAVATVLIPKM